MDTRSQIEPQEDSPEHAVIGSYPTARQAHEAGLSVLAFGKPYWIHFSEGRFQLLVQRTFETELKREVEIAAIRNRYWPPGSLDLPAQTISKLPTVFSICAIVTVFSIQTHMPWLTELGVNSSSSVWELGQWWRILTAITLHADLSHLSGNILGLSLFGYLSCRYLGNGLAWLLVVLSAAAANATGVVLNLGQPYQSLGASTAVFAALGLISGFPLGTFILSKHPLQQRDWLIPFLGGCILFAWMGGGEFPTDVAAHLWSFAYGLLAAILVATTALHTKLTTLHQNLLLLIAPALLAGAWLWALST